MTVQARVNGPAMVPILAAATRLTRGLGERIIGETYRTLVPPSRSGKMGEERIFLHFEDILLA